MKKPFLFLVFILLFSCENNESKNSSGGEVAAVEKTIKVKSENTSDPPDDNAEGVFPSSDEEVFPLEFDVKTYFIEPGTYHATDELPKIKKKENWVAFYKNEAGEMELKAVKISFKRVFDELMDTDKRNPTGIEPIISNAENCEFVLNPIGGMKPKKLVPLIPNQKDFQPGDLVTIKSDNTVYKVYATGQKVMENDQEGIREFKLFVTEISKNGEKKNQLLMQVPTFGKHTPPFIRLVLAAYLDDDTIPDFILSDENTTYIYLSKYADSTEIVKIVGSTILPSGC